MMCVPPTQLLHDKDLTHSKDCKQTFDVFTFVAKTLQR